MMTPYLPEESSTDDAGCELEYTLVKYHLRVCPIIGMVFPWSQEVH